MTRKQFEKQERISRRLIFIVAGLLAVHMIISTVRGNVRTPEKIQEQQETQIKSIPEAAVEEVRTAQAEETQTGKEPEAEETPDKYAVFDYMSRDWGGENEGFVFYEIPEEYAREDGYFPEIMQIYTYCLCKQEGVSYPLIVAMIERESGYRFDEVGDDGKSYGYMQINKAANEDIAKEIGCTDLLNPYQNVRVGIHIMKKHIEKYGTIQDALAAYNYGAAGAYRHLWSKGIYVYDYNREIMQRMKEIEEELQE